MKNPHCKTVQQKMAACESLGLSYWCDHPAPGCLWAVDECQQPHVVRWDRRSGSAYVTRWAA